jgi:hypothetical protein
MHKENSIYTILRIRFISPNIQSGNNHKTRQEIFKAHVSISCFSAMNGLTDLINIELYTIIKAVRKMVVL